MIVGDKPLVSIIVTCYNQGPYLGDALSSVLNQSYQNWECWIVNDGSSDNTEEEARRFCGMDNRFNYLSHSNQGVSFSRNQGLANAKGSYVQFLDGDDILESGKIERQVDFMLQNPQVDIVYGSSRYFFHNTPGDYFILTHRGGIPTIETHYADEHQKEALLAGNIATICATLYKRKIFEVVKGFEDIVFEDWLLHIECAFNGFRFHYERIDGTCCFIRITSHSQLQRHANSNRRRNVFGERLNKIRSDFNYISPYQDFLDNEKAKVKKESFIKKAARLLLPPIIAKTYTRLK